MTPRTVAAPAVEPLPGFVALEWLPLHQQFSCADLPSSRPSTLRRDDPGSRRRNGIRLLADEAWRAGFRIRWGRANLKDFYQDLGKRTGVVIREKQTSSVAKAETELLKALEAKCPVMLGGDMGMLPWFDLPADYHFGGHTFVACGYNGHETVLCSDIDQKASGVKKGFLAPISREQLRKARGSQFKPFPPKNLRLEFDFSGFHPPQANDIVGSMRQMIDAELNPPIKNFGVRGMRHAADELLKWPDQFSDRELRMQLFNLYIFIEIGGTGGGCFRPMYSRFLNESAEIIRNPALKIAADAFERIGVLFTKVGLLFKDAAKVKDLQARIEGASRGFSELADKEETTCRWLEKRL
jgi:hypothetical protein